MSKNKNYSKYFDEKKNIEETPAVEVEETVDESPAEEVEESVEEEPVEEVPVTTFLEVTAGALNMRASADKSGDVLRVLHKGDVLTTELPIAGEWLAVRDQAGLNGFVMAQFVKEA